MSKLKALILTGDAAESLEVMYPYQRLKKERRARERIEATSGRQDLPVHFDEIT